LISENHSALRGLFEKRFSPLKTSCGATHLESIVSHFSNIPYENLTKIIRASAFKDPDERLRQPLEVLQDYIRWGAGGTCFSLTFCLQALLRDYGYTGCFRMADLGSRQYNHCALVVYFQDRPYLLDPGYLVTRPLPIPEKGSIVYETRLRPVILERDQMKEGLNFSTIETDGVRHRYYLHGNDCDEDTFIGFWHDSFTWNMMHSMLVTKVIPDGRFYLHNRYVRWFNRDGHESARLKEQFDESVTELTGIDRTIVIQAREILSATRSL
jgi:arylamine N-acetyltransferase